jgi:opacity protein-like surface antigen
MSYDTGNCFSISGGYYLDGGRIEGEFGFKVANPKASSVNGKGTILRDADVSVTTLSYMINAYYDVKTESTLLPYVGAGFGVISAHFKNVESIKTDTVLGTQLIAGLGYKLDNDVTLDLSYHYQVADFDLKINGNAQSYDSSSVLFGARMIF